MTLSNSTSVVNWKVKNFHLVGQKIAVDIDMGRFVQPGPKFYRVNGFKNASSESILTHGDLQVVQAL